MQKGNSEVMKRFRLWLIAVMAVILCAGCKKSAEQQIAEQLELGQKYLLNQEYEEAVVAFEKVIKLEARQISAYVGLSEAYVALEENHKAIEVLEQAQEILEKEYDEASPMFDEAGQVFDDLADFYEQGGENEKASAVRERKEKVLHGDSPPKEQGKTEGGDEAKQLQSPEIDEYELYRMFSPWLNYNHVNMLETGRDGMDRPVIDTMQELGKRKTFANLCFLYFPQIFQEEFFKTGLPKNQAERYASYNRVFIDEIYSRELEQRVMTIDKDKARREFARDWAGSLDLSKERYEYEIAGFNGYGIFEAYDLDELNQAYRMLFGDVFQEFTAEELTEYNFFYDAEHGIACRKSVYTDPVEVWPSSYSIHRYVRDVRHEKNMIMFAMDYCVFQWEMGVPWSDWDLSWGKTLEELRPYADGNGSSNAWYETQYPVILQGKQVPLLNTLDFNYCSIDSSKYCSNSAEFVDLDHDEYIWDGKGLKRAMSEEDVFVMLQKNTETLMEDQTWADYFSIPYTVEFQIEMGEEGIRIISMERIDHGIIDYEGQKRQEEDYWRKQEWNREPV